MSYILSFYHPEIKTIETTVHRKWWELWKEKAVTTSHSFSSMKLHRIDLTQKQGDFLLNCQDKFNPIVMDMIFKAAGCNKSEVIMLQLEVGKVSSPYIPTTSSEETNHMGNSGGFGDKPWHKFTKSEWDKKNG